MTLARRLAHSSRVLQPGSGVSWRVGPEDQPDSLRTGTVVRLDLDGLHAWVRTDGEAGERRKALADLDGAFCQPLPAPRAVPDLHPAQELPAPLTHTLELLGLLDQGVEIQPGQRTVLAPILTELRDRGFIVEGPTGSGVWKLTPKGREVLDA